MQVIISEAGKRELKRLQFDIVISINKMLKYIPKRHLLGLSHILVTDLPSNRKTPEDKCMASYFEKFDNQSAYIALYLKNLFGHVKSAESFRQIFPIQELGLAQSIYHEIGHHVRHIRTHGIKKHKSEHFANMYTKQVTAKYILDNANYIDNCLVHLDRVANSDSLSQDVIRKMRVGWERSYKEAVKTNRVSS